MTHTFIYEGIVNADAEWVTRVVDILYCYMVLPRTSGVSEIPKACAELPCLPADSLLPGYRDQ